MARSLAAAKALEWGRLEEAVLEQGLVLGPLACHGAAVEELPVPSQAVLLEARKAQAEVVKHERGGGVSKVPRRAHIVPLEDSQEREQEPEWFGSTLKKDT